MQIFQNDDSNGNLTEFIKFGISLVIVTHFLLNYDIMASQVLAMLVFWFS